MKRNHILFLLLTFTVLLALAIPAMAADSTVTYYGLTEGFEFAPGSDYTDSDLFDNFKGVMPGDVRTETITVINKAKDCDKIKVYIQAQRHNTETGDNANPMSETVAQANNNDLAYMHDFLYQLSMTVKNGTETIYNASPDTLDGFAEPVYLGTIAAGATITLDVQLQVPITLDNTYANRVGEVDWLFLVYPFNDTPTPPPTPDFPQNVIVNKVWVDDGIGRPAGITVHLLQNGVVYDSVVLSEKNNWSHAWTELNRFYKWTVEEEVPEGYVATYKTNSSGWVTTITNTKILEDQLTVEKVWDDNSSPDRPASVDVVLLKDGQYHDEARLDDANEWTHTWKHLSVNNSWSVVEKTVPEGYFVSYSFDEQEDKVIVTNTLEEPEPTELTVYKIWEDNGENRPDSITVQLLQDGVAVDSAVITAADNWTYTWTELPAGFNWTAQETEVPGYRAEYKQDGTNVMITNIALPVSRDITVKKVWSDRGTGRPDSAEIALYNGETVVEAVLLSEGNNWTYTWKNLDGSGNWRVVEDYVPEGYTPSYEVDGDVVTVTNTEILLQTGQLNWPVLVFGGLGVIILGAGILLLRPARRKKEHDHA